MSRSGVRTSVLMPAYRAEDTIREAVESALTQTLADFELLVVDDASPMPVQEGLTRMLGAAKKVVELAGS